VGEWVDLTSNRVDMNPNISIMNFLIWIILIVIFTLSCEEQENVTNDYPEQDTLVVKDTIRFGDLITLFQNRCYHCHSEPEYSFYALNLDSYENTMYGSQNGAIVIPFEPQQSLLYTKCSGGSIEGERMPQDDTTYFDIHPEKLQLIFDWIYFGCLE